MLAEFVGPLPLQLQIEQVKEMRLQLHSLTLNLLMKIQVSAAEELGFELHLQQLG
jgi:hypothetical protein